MIIIEPDDFAVGAQITSEHAEIIRYTNHIAGPAYAVTGTETGYGAPTGDNHFGNPVVVFTGRNDIPMYGLVFSFLSPVDSVSVWALNYAYLPLHLDCSIWLVGATDRGGAACDGRLQQAVLGEPTLYTFTFGGALIDQITFGGGNSIGAIIFDRLEAHVVPEPSTLALFGIALFGAGLAGHRRNSLATSQIE